MGYKRNKDSEIQKAEWKKKRRKKKFEKEAKFLAMIDEKKQEPSTSGEQAGDDEMTADKDVSVRSWKSLSIAIPGSILDNAQSPELRTYLVGQIARAATIYCIDEIVVFDEDAALTEKQIETFERSGLGWVEGERPNCNLLMAYQLQYLECPQYLRKYLFPLNKHLRNVGLLNPLDSPHHMRGNDLSSPYREAVTLSKNTGGKGSYCYAGLQKEVQIDRNLEPNIRVTLHIPDYETNKGKLSGRVVSPLEPYEVGGAYWGYQVRIAKSISDALKGGEYDVAVGTSERGSDISQVTLPKDKKILLVLGGVKGLESCVQADEELEESDPSQLFQYYLNTCTNQGSATIRTEEALLISLCAMKTNLSTG